MYFLPLIATYLLINRSFATIDSDLESDYENEKCNPVLDKQCLACNEALGRSIHETFSHGTEYFAVTSCRKGVRFGSNGLQLTIRKEFDNPALTSSFYILYGKVEAEIKGSFGPGIVSSFYLQSDDLDEIDIAEILGGDPFNYQTNYFIKGNVTTYDRARYHKLNKSPLNEFYTYGVEWTPKMITWYLNGEPVRQLNRLNKQGYPSSPMVVKLSLWSGETTQDQGTIAWSRGLTDYNNGPFMMHIKNLKVSDYSTGESYMYGWLPNGQWMKLNAKGGSIYKDGSETQSPPKFPTQRHEDWTVPHERSVILPTSTKIKPTGTEKPFDFASTTIAIDKLIKKINPKKSKNSKGLYEFPKQTGVYELVRESWETSIFSTSTETHFQTTIKNGESKTTSDRKLKSKESSFIQFPEKEGENDDKKKSTKTNKKQKKKKTSEASTFNFTSISFILLIETILIMTSF
ncbi:uncharacterized protein KGF55_005709 [Candida pseudojiufengensis]|uniref:uncharacterized protein n=1 Tax=Candida pseudojiufengensis TaxID=497109 RepID=UPI0022247039|nr:uncharacterized protein KGF55_005709 [Candida pseudojiufengensis]KAI5958711.1 hypothetical protein KGF55_005709 [Candida pseudojiufengensis]